MEYAQISLFEKAKDENVSDWADSDMPDVSAVHSVGAASFNRRRFFFLSDSNGAGIDESEFSGGSEVDRLRLRDVLGLLLIVAVVGNWQKVKKWLTSKRKDG